MNELATRAAALSARIEAEGFTLFWHRSSVVKLLFVAQGPVCAICRSEMRKSDATIDHVTPRAAGGKDVLSNFLLAHEACNHARGCRAADEGQRVLHAGVLCVMGLS